jgi:hypothetical protein
MLPDYRIERPPMSQDDATRSAIVEFLQVVPDDFVAAAPWPE